MHYGDLFTDEDVAQQWQGGDDGGKNTLVVHRRERQVVHLAI